MIEGSILQYMVENVDVVFILFAKQVMDMVFGGLIVWYLIYRRNKRKGGEDD